MNENMEKIVELIEKTGASMPSATLKPKIILIPNTDSKEIMKAIRIMIEETGKIEVEALGCLLKIRKLENK